ncbi:MAG: hypothetical protein QOD36_2225, partial [Mycobacterium sp.]|nr:hypothetical protein [Mycobacterium sp.]
MAALPQRLTIGIDAVQFFAVPWRPLPALIELPSNRPITPVGCRIWTLRARLHFSPARPE